MQYSPLGQGATGRSGDAIWHATPLPPDEEEDEEDEDDDVEDEVLPDEDDALPLPPLELPPLLVDLAGSFVAMAEPPGLPSSALPRLVVLPRQAAVITAAPSANATRPVEEREERREEVMMLVRVGKAPVPSLFLLISFGSALFEDALHARSKWALRVALEEAPREPRGALVIAALLGGSYVERFPFLEEHAARKAGACLVEASRRALRVPAREIGARGGEDGGLLAQIARRKLGAHLGG